ncbi:hypothetical protein [Nocardioides sp. Soil777]|uniref:hypothetical protein n=1 Tax=Nocardioides sp. Soil777 TaxID=1736409 RepID=UPI000A9ED29B|nr:hypothetical protein [Nocardioides sp. Soil777]
MATLTAWQYQTPLGARAGAVRLRTLVDLEALEVLDAITVTWVQGAHQPRLTPVRPRMPSPVGDHSVLAGLFRRLALDGTPDASDGSLTGLAAVLDGTGITPGFLLEVVDHLAPGHSTLMVLSGTADPETVRPVVERGLAGGGVTLLYADVPDDAAARLGRALGLRFD